MAGRLAGKTIAISGTASGQGRAAAEMFAREGARIAGCDLNAVGAQETVERVLEAGGEMISSHPADLAKEEEVQGWLASALAEFGGIDVLYNNASLPKFALVPDMTRQAWDFTLANELTIAYSASRALWGHFVKRRSGVIISTASTAGMVAFEGLGNLAHAAAKGGVIAMTRQLAVEGASHGIRANSISPGFVITEGTERLQRNDELMATMLGKHMIGRLGRPEDVVYCAMYLASDEASWVTGANFVVDGGLTAW